MYLKRKVALPCYYYFNPFRTRGCCNERWVLKQWLTLYGEGQSTPAGAFGSPEQHNAALNCTPEGYGYSCTEVRQCPTFRRITRRHVKGGRKSKIYSVYMIQVDRWSELHSLRIK